MTPHQWESKWESNPWIWRKWTCTRCGFWYRTNTGRPPPDRPLLLALGPSEPANIPVDCDEAMALKIMYDCTQEF